MLELYRISGHIFFLSYNALYRNACYNIRYALELIVQALYIDHRHPNTSLGTKIEILKEVEDKREYCAGQLIEKLRIGGIEKSKQTLINEYHSLSGIIHSSHEQVITTISDILGGKGIPATVDCDEVSNIYESLKIMYDIFFFLLLYHFPENKESLETKPEFIKSVKVNKLCLLSQIFNIRLR